MLGYLGGPWEKFVGLDSLLYYKGSERLRQQFWTWLPSIRVCRHRQLRPLHNSRDAAYCEQLIIKEKQQPNKLTDEEVMILLWCVPEKFVRRYDSASRGQLYGPMGNWLYFLNVTYSFFSNCGFVIKVATCVRFTCSATTDRSENNFGAENIGWACV